MRLPQRIRTPARRDFFPAFRQSGSRSPGDIKWIVWHDTEGGSADSVAAFFHTPLAKGSAHLVVDDMGAQRCLADDTIPWGAPGANSEGLHIEQCGFASWSKLQWRLHEMMLHRTAFKTARWCKLYGIPTEFVDANGLRAGRPGITTHAEVSKAFHQSTHTDPGPNYPRIHVMRLVRFYRRLMRG